MNTCPQCQASSNQHRIGFQHGKQRYRCRQCGKRYTPGAKTYGDTIRQQAVRMYLNGLGFRQIARQLGVVHQTVANWVHAASAALPEPPEPPQPVEVIEQDELYARLGTKKRTST
jgi:transposase-like protein